MLRTRQGTCPDPPAETQCSRASMTSLLPRVKTHHGHFPSRCVLAHGRASGGCRYVVRAVVWGRWSLWLQQAHPSMPSFLIWDPWCGNSVVSIAMGERQGLNSQFVSICSEPGCPLARHRVGGIPSVSLFHHSNNPGRERRVAPSCNKDVRLREVQERAHSCVLWTMVLIYKGD